LFPYVISSPLGFLFGSLGLLTNEIIAVTKPIYIIPTLIVTAAMVTGAFYLSKNIKAENIGRDFLYKWFYDVQQALCCLCIVSLFGISYLTFANLLIAFLTVFVTFIVYFIGHVIAHRGRLGKELKSGVIKYAVMLLSSVLLCSILVASKGFGAEKYIPPSFDIKGVRVQTYGLSSSLDFVTEVYGFNKDVVDNWNFTRSSDYDRDEWGRITDETRRIHRLLINTPNNSTLDEGFFDFGYYDDYTITIEYELKNGLVVTRNYRYSREDKGLLIEAGVFRETDGKNDDGWL